MHILGKIEKKALCKCDKPEYEVRDFDPMWHDGEVWCRKCNTFIRGYDAG